MCRFLQVGFAGDDGKINGLCRPSAPMTAGTSRPVGRSRNVGIAAYGKLEKLLRYPHPHERTAMSKLTVDHPECTPKQKACPHKEFRAQVNVNRFEDTGKFLAEITVTCLRCQIPMRFIGVAAGLGWSQPTCSIDALVLNAPIEPELVRVLHAGASYEIPEGDHVKH